MSKFISKVVTGISTVALAASMLVMPATTHAAAAGEVYSTPDGTVWFITTDMHRRPFTSAGAFLSYGFLSWSQVRPADSTVTALPTGAFIAPQDGRIFCATATKGSDVSGECSLITGSMKAAFTSAAVFTAQGFSFSRAFYGDSSFLTKTSNIDNGSAQHRPGVLINNSGTVQLVVSGGLWGVPSLDVFNSWGWSFADVVPANSADTALTQTGVIPARMPGQLVPTATTNGGGDNGNDNADCNNLQGNAGDITITENSDFSNEDIGEGEEDQGVVGFDVEADDSSDVNVTSVKVALYQSDNTVSQHLDDYVDHVSIFRGDTEVGSADASDFSKDSNVYTKTISLDDCASVSAGETGDFSVRLTAVDNLDSSDIATENWQAEVYQVRFEDADGVTSTQTVGDGDVTASTAGDVQEPMDFVNFATAADVELRTDLTDGEEDTNQAHNVIVDNDNNTNNVEILKFTLDAKGDSDINVDEIPVLISDVNSAGDLDSIISSASLYMGDTKVDSQTVVDAGSNDTETITFDNLDIDINAGDTEDFTVKVNVRPVDDGNNYAQGSTLQAQVTTSGIDATDETGDDVATADLTGSAVGENISLFSDGITVEVNEAETNVTATDVALGDIAQFHWNVTLTNIGDDDVYVNADNVDVVSSSATDDVDQVYAIDQSGSNALTSISGTVDEDGGTGTKITADASAYNGVYSGETFFKLTPGQSRTLDIVVTGTNGTAAGQVRAYLSSIEWTTDDITAATAKDAVTRTINSYTAQLQQDSKTPFAAIN